MNKKRMLAALLLGAFAVSPVALADPALDRAMDRAVENYKRSKAGGGSPGKGDMRKGGQMGDAMKQAGKGDMMKGGQMGDAMKQPGKGEMMKGGKGKP